MTDQMEFRKSSYSGQGVNCVEVANLGPRLRKSSYSAQGQACVEVAHVPADFWKSSYSAQNQNCVEVADLPQRIAIRDSKQPERGHLTFPTSEWAAFLSNTRHGEL
ncbi:hypothetical protein HNR23_003056 [Nocardiopsis mwathae]|uniref:DUF397 domain-containing protein n=1 Tax=Nocardiopsis mwathae TaxID=1472723 RepID=A0A7W9YK31_9ACTN|nr:DUF397 domain-containing protein [Nocardiopsis mwathae]MBB6172996.1 hypothetical protein [Nocardiopsis mwathae]